MKTFILAVLVIAIIHLVIRYLLQSKLLHKSKQMVSSSILEEMFTCKKEKTKDSTNDDSSFVKVREKVNNDDDEEEEEDSDESGVDLKKMQEELMDYIVGNKEVFKEDDSKYPVLPDDTAEKTNSNYHLGKDKDDNDISKFFETKINKNDYSLYTAKEDNTEHSLVKKIDKGTDELGRWEYENENVINGGDIDGGLKGYDLSDSYYANIN